MNNVRGMMWDTAESRVQQHSNNLIVVGVMLIVVVIIILIIIAIGIFRRNAVESSRLEFLQKYVHDQHRAVDKGGRNNLKLSKEILDDEDIIVSSRNQYKE